jgi:hypothetical protein
MGVVVVRSSKWGLLLCTRVCLLDPFPGLRYDLRFKVCANRVIGDDNETDVDGKHFGA